MRKLVLGTGMGFPEISTLEQIRLIKKAGWDGVFTDWCEEDGNRSYREAIDREGLIYQSVHAPFKYCGKMWEEGEEGDAEVERQIRCLRDCAAVGVKLVVMHTIIGFDKFTPNELGVERFGKIFDAAKQYGVTVALENTEGEVYLEALMKAYRDHPAVRFCIDTGHEMCYNESRDMITKYGDRLVCTHINDNMKVTGDHITWHDDAHLLPFDGLADWEGVARRLKAVGYEGPLTFELTVKNKPNRHTHDIYAHLDFEGYIALALERARRFGELMD